ncbi:hypothetical protein [Cerasicoccus arenae]|uniref:Uncharacterized protein n=1 Tax=Cerasicoccus arenae TaxID=424488 RepID=A0A8J3DH83_9BACT|nr:hypothetical protein [Cerasicoccus arenae]MBK1857143.1 hypothetical protein [Cerasicoccus arenae]GHB92613.1 hypothetical protein GCM10007047_04740 [Cerasicoccus arenae]
MKLLALFFIFLGLTLSHADIPLRECTLQAPASAVKLSSAQLKPYFKGSEVVLQAQGFLFPRGTDKSIDAAPTDKNDTAFRAAINYHRSLRTQGVDEIVTYWHPALQDSKRQQLSQPAVMASTKEIFSNLEHVELLGMLVLNGREVVFIRYNGNTYAYVTVSMEGVYYLVSDPGLEPQTAIATAAFDSGKATMASR